MLIIAKTNFYSTKGVSSNEKAELKELMNWANEKIGLKLEKARREGSLRKITSEFEYFSISDKKQSTKDNQRRGDYTTH